MELPRGQYCFYQCSWNLMFKLYLIAVLWSTGVILPSPIYTVCFQSSEVSSSSQWWSSCLIIANWYGITKWTVIKLTDVRYHFGRDVSLWWDSNLHPRVESLTLLLYQSYIRMPYVFEVLSVSQHSIKDLFQHYIIKSYF